MADTHFKSRPQPQNTASEMDSTPFPSKRRKIVGQCPTCQQSFASRHELRAHISDPVTHAPASDSDAISFGELSDDYSSSDEASLPKQSPAHEHEPTLDTDGFEFASATPDLDQDGFESFENGEPMFSTPYVNAEQGSIHTLPDSDTQPTTEYTPIETPPLKARQVRGGALGVLYCGTCDTYFGNETVFKRHFMFGVKHGEEPRDMGELYYKVWGSSWKDVAQRREGRVEDVDDMEL
jgi:hypothetical protein